MKYKLLTLLIIIICGNYSIMIYAQKEHGTFTDNQDGHTYKWVRIGNQIWMAENLRATNYSNGDLIPDGTGKGDITRESNPKYWFAYDDNLNNVSTYGRLYTWYAITDGRNVCPTGWHVPGDDEWKELEVYLGMAQAKADGTEWRGTNEGDKLKYDDIDYWPTPILEATNSSGFSALPSGMRSSENTSKSLGNYGYWWSSTEESDKSAWGRGLGHGKSEVYRNSADKSFGFSIKCIWDKDTDLSNVLKHETDTSPSEKEKDPYNIVAHFIGHDHFVLSVCFSPDGKYALSGSYDKTLKLWDIEDKKEIKSFEGHTDIIWSVCYSISGKYALSGGKYGNIKLWDITSGKQIKALKHFREVTSVCFSQDEKYFLSGSSNNTLELWDIASAKFFRLFGGHTGTVNSVCFSPNGKFLLSGSEDKTIKLWNIALGNEIKTFRGHSMAVSSVCFSPDGKYILSGSADNTVRLWDTESGKEIKNFKGHTGIVWSVRFSPDGKYALSGSDDRTIKLWDVASGNEVMTLKRHGQSVHSVCFSPDGKNILSGSADKTVILWDITSGK